MLEINRLVRKAAARLFAVRLVRALTIALAVAVGCLLVLRIVERLISFRPDWMWTWIGFVSAAALGAVAWVFFTRHDRHAVARELDESANLRESISTALCVADNPDPWARASVEQAREVAGKVKVRQAFPFRVPRLWPVPVAGAVLFALLGLVPQADLLKLMSKAQAKDEQAQAIEQAKAEVKAMDKKLDELLAKVDDGALKEEPDAASEPPTAPATPDEVRREAVRKLTTMQDRLEQLRSGDKAAALEEMNNRLEQLKQPKGASPELSSLVQKMQQGKFDEASEALTELVNKMSDSSLSEQQKQALAKQLEQLADQLKELAEKQGDMEKALSELGLDKQLASNPEALAEALKNMDALSQEQKDQLMQMAQAAKQAGQMCESMGEACKNAAAAMAQGQNAAGEMGELGDQLSELEALQMEMANLDAAMSECQGQLAALGQMMGQCEGIANNPFAQAFQKPGGSGDRGPGGGQAPEPAEADFALKRERSKSPRQDGPIIGTTVVQGDQVRGESVQQFNQAVQAGAAEAAEAVETMTVPREYHDALKHYFGRLEAKAKSAPAPPAKPASDVKN